MIFCVKCGFRFQRIWYMFDYILYNYIFILMTKFILVTTGKCGFFQIMLPLGAFVTDSCSWVNLTWLSWMDRMPTTITKFLLKSPPWYPSFHIWHQRTGHLREIVDTDEWGHELGKRLLILWIHKNAPKCSEMLALQSIRMNEHVQVN